MSQAGRVVLAFGSGRRRRLFRLGVGFRVGLVLQELRAFLQRAHVVAVCALRFRPCDRRLEGVEVLFESAPRRGPAACAYFPIVLFAAVLTITPDSSLLSRPEAFAPRAALDTQLT